GEGSWIEPWHSAGSGHAVQVRIHAGNQIRPASIARIATARDVDNRHCLYYTTSSNNWTRSDHSGCGVLINNVWTRDQHFDRQTSASIKQSANLPSAQKGFSDRAGGRSKFLTSAIRHIIEGIEIECLPNIGSVVTLLR